MKEILAEFDKDEEDKVFESVFNLLLRVSTLEKILLDKGIMTKEEYVKALELSITEVQDTFNDLIKEDDEISGPTN